MSNIKVNPSELNDLGNKLKLLSNDYDEKIDMIEKTFREIDSFILWDGSDEKSYIAKIESRYILSLKKIGVELKDYSDFLIKTSKAYEIIENYFNEKEVEI